MDIPADDTPIPLTPERQLLKLRVSARRGLASKEDLAELAKQEKLLEEKSSESNSRS